MEYTIRVNACLTLDSVKANNVDEALDLAAVVMQFGQYKNLDADIDWSCAESVQVFDEDGNDVVLEDA